MVSTPDRERNLAEAERLIAEAAADGAQLVLLPEYFCFMGFKDTDKLSVREPYGDGPIQRFLADAARRHRVWVIGGTLPLTAPEATRVLNTTLVFNPQGEEAARYDKIHLFNFEKGDESFDEARTIRPGEEVRTFDAPFGRVGLSVCYDLRFPELYRRLGDCALIVVPSAFTYTTGRAHRLRRSSEYLTLGGAVLAVSGARSSRLAAAAGGLALLAGSALQRFGTFEAGVASTKDPKYVVVPQREGLEAADGERHPPR